MQIAKVKTLSVVEKRHSPALKSALANVEICERPSHYGSVLTRVKNVEICERSSHYGSALTRVKNVEICERPSHHGPVLTRVKNVEICERSSRYGSERENTTPHLERRTQKCFGAKLKQLLTLSLSVSVFRARDPPVLPWLKLPNGPTRQRMKIYFAPTGRCRRLQGCGLVSQL